MNAEKKDETTEKKLKEILSVATETIPDSVNLWHARLKYLFASGEEEEAETVFSEVQKYDCFSRISDITYI